MLGLLNGAQIVEIGARGRDVDVSPSFTAAEAGGAAAPPRRG
jgi:hypothetical protein